MGVLTINMSFSRIRLRSFFGWMIIGVIVTIIPLAIVGAGDGAFDFASQVLFFFIFPLLWLFYKTRKHNVEFMSFFDQPSSYSWKLILIATAMGIVFSYGMSMIQFYILAHLIPGFLVELLTEGDMIDTTTFSNILGVVSACIFAPVMEEVIFRGFFLNRMAYKWGIKPAIIVSSLIFGFGHIDVVGAFLFGLIMCLLYIKTRSLWTPIIVHALNNTIVTIIQFSGMGEQEEVIHISDFQADSNLWIGCILILISLIWMIPFIRRHWRTVKEVGLPKLRVVHKGAHTEREDIYHRVILTDRHMAIELPDEIVNHLQLEENDYVKIQTEGEKIIVTKAE